MPPLGFSDGHHPLTRRRVRQAAVPYGGTPLPVWFFRADEPKTRRPGPAAFEYRLAAVVAMPGCVTP